MIKLSLLIPTIERHSKYLFDLLSELSLQKLPYAGTIEILIDRAENDSVGVKRNRLLDKAKGEYVAFIDADDCVSENYIELLMQAIETKCDCASLKGEYSVDGKFDGIFEHSLKYKKWETVNGEVKYLRYPNHLNCIKSTIAKQFKYPDKNFGEDHDWSTLIHESQLIKTEYYIPQVIYFYRYKTIKL